MPTYIVCITIHAAAKGNVATSQQEREAQERRNKIEKMMLDLGATKYGEQTTFLYPVDLVKAYDVWSKIINQAKTRQHPFLQQDWLGVIEAKPDNRHEG